MLTDPSQASDAVPSGTSLVTSQWTPDEDVGNLRWYFADSESGAESIPADSYEGSAYHTFTGVSTKNYDVGGIHYTDVEEHAAAQADAEMRVDSHGGDYGEAARPLLVWGNLVGYSAHMVAALSRTATFVTPNITVSLD